MVRTDPITGKMIPLRPNDPSNPKVAVDPIQQFQQNYQRQVMQMNYPKEYAAAMEDEKAQEQRDRASKKRIGNPVGGYTTVGLMAGPGRELSSINTWGNFGGFDEESPKESNPFAPGAGYQPKGPSDPYYQGPRKRFAMGGPVEGPGGPKDDLINAKLSDGEFVMPAEAVEFYGLDRLHKMMAKAKEGLAEIKPAPQAPRSLQMPQPMPMMMGNPMGQPQPTPGFAYGGMMESMPMRGYAEGGPVLANNPEEEEFGLRRLAPNPYSVGPGYSITPMDPFAPAPAVSPSPSPQVSPSPSLPLPPAPAMANGRQPQPVVASPMDTPMMRPAPLTMTEKERQAMPISRSRTPQANPEFEAALAGLTGMQKRRARQGLQMEEATFQRNQTRADAAQAVIDARGTQERAGQWNEWLAKNAIQNQQAIEAEQRQNKNARELTAEERKFKEQQRIEDRKLGAEYKRIVIDGKPTEYAGNGLGNLINARTQEPVNLTPEQAEKLGLETVGADNKGNFSYRPKETAIPMVRYWDPINRRAVELQQGDVLPENSDLIPLRPTPAAAPAAAGTAPTRAKIKSITPAK